MYGYWECGEGFNICKYKDYNHKHKKTGSKGTYMIIKPLYFTYSEKILDLYWKQLRIC